MKLSVFALLLFFIGWVSTALAQPNTWSLDTWMTKLEKPSDSVYIQDRKQLYKLTGDTCFGERISFTSNTLTKESIFIVLQTSKFNAAYHKMDLNDTVFKYVHNEKRIDHIKAKNLIDGKLAFGIDGDVPKTEIRFIDIIWGKYWLDIPEKAYKNLFEPHFCTDSISLVEAYITRNEKLLYIYLGGWDGAGSYTAKLVFNRKRYVTRLINTNEMSTGYDFLDRTAIPE